MDRRAWWVTVHGVTKSWTQLSTHACIQIDFRSFCFHLHFLKTFISSLLFSVIHWLFSRIMVDLHVFVFLLFFFLKLVFCFHSVVIRKDTWYDVSFLWFTGTCFVAKCVTILENIPCAYIFCCFWMECSIGACYVYLV